jgi:hypothetical protein
MKSLSPPLPVISRLKTTPWDAFVVIGTFLEFEAGPLPSAAGAAGPAPQIPWPSAMAAMQAVQISTISAALLMQEQLKVAGFWSQLDANNGDDDDKGDNNVVDKDNDDNNVMKEMPMDKRRDYSRSPGWRRGRECGNWSKPGGGSRPPPLIPPPWVGGGGTMVTRTPKIRDGWSPWGWTLHREGGGKTTKTIGTTTMTILTVAGCPTC